MKKYIAFLFTLLFVNGCYTSSNQKLVDNLEKNQNKFEQTLKTNKVTIMQDGRFVGFITTLYIIDEKYENFIVGIYDEEESQNLSYSLGGLDPILVKKLNNNDKKLANIPLKNRWSSYYDIYFTKSDTQILDLVVTNGKLWSREIKTSKVPNYLNNKHNTIF